MDFNLINHFNKDPNEFFHDDFIPDLLGYKSPIEVIQTEMESRFEENIFQAVQRFGVIGI